MSISADGYVAGPDQSEQHPLGLGGEALHVWHLGPDKDHPVNRQMVSDMMDGMGARIMGRNMFDSVRGEWGDSGWTGWWGDTAVSLPGVRRDALPTRPDRARPRRLPADAISIAGGASCARQAIVTGLVDDVDLRISPVILGSSERLFDGLEAGKPALELARVLQAPGVAHLRYRVVR